MAATTTVAANISSSASNWICFSSNSSLIFLVSSMFFKMISFWLRVLLSSWRSLSSSWSHLFWVKILFKVFKKCITGWQFWRGETWFTKPCTRKPCTKSSTRYHRGVWHFWKPALVFFKISISSFFKINLFWRPSCFCFSIRSLYSVSRSCLSWSRIISNVADRIFISEFSTLNLFQDLKFVFNWYFW